MNWPRMLVRAKRMAARPPTMRQVLVYGGIIVACLALAGVERLVGWPDWLTVNSMKDRP